MIFRSFEALFSVFFPAECQKCNQSLSYGEKILCPGCTASANEHRLALSDAWQQPVIPGIKNMWAAFNYKHEIRELLTRVKFKREFYLLEPLAQSAAGIFQAAVSDVYYDALIPMPTTWQRRLFRRFNPAEILARHLARWTTVPVRGDLLQRKIDSVPQSSLSREQRKWNVFGAFEARSSRKIAGKSFLLIDDIVTTGTTAAEAARVLLQAGAKRVDLFALARSAAASSVKTAVLQGSLS